MEAFEHIPMIEQPREIKIDLYPHQLASIHAMEEIEREKRVSCTDSYIETDMGINADITGYGKSLSMVTLVLRDKMSWDASEDHIMEEVTTLASQHIKKVLQKGYIRINTTLVLVGPSVCQQWVKEFAHTKLRVAEVTTRRIACNIDVHDYDVVIVTISMFNRLVERYHNMAWKRFIFDEPGHLRVPAMREIRAGFTWFVTATPDIIASRHHACRTSYMYKLVGGWYDFDRFRADITIKNDDDFVKQSFEMPPTHHEQYECYFPIYQAVNGLVSNKVNKLIEAGNISGAINALGGKRTDNIIDLVKHRKNLELEEIRSKIRIWTLRNNDAKIQDWKDRETKIMKQLVILNERFKNILKSNCVICQCQLDKPVMEPNCQNIFCGECLLTWLLQKNNCPMCRRDIKNDELVYITTDKENKEKPIDEIKTMTKEETIIDIISKKKDGHFIIFSDWNETFEVIRNVLKENKIKFVEVKGSVKTRNRALKKYREGKVNVVFLNSKYNGSGINMQETTDIVMYHQMGEQTKTQILGRANRIGRKVPLQVHHLINKDV